MSPDTNRHLRTQILLFSSLCNDPVQFIDRFLKVKDKGGLIIAVDAEAQHGFKSQQKITIDAGQVTRVSFFEVFIPAVKDLIPVCHAEAFFQHHLQAPVQNGAACGMPAQLNQQSIPAQAFPAHSDSWFP